MLCSVMNKCSLTMLVGPTFGLVVGRFLTEAQGWCSIFWVLKILVSDQILDYIHPLKWYKGACTNILGSLCLRETYGPNPIGEKSTAVAQRDWKWLLPCQGQVKSQLRPAVDNVDNVGHFASLDASQSFYSGDVIKARGENTRGAMNEWMNECYLEICAKGRRRKAG